MQCSAGSRDQLMPFSCWSVGRSTWARRYSPSSPAGRGQGRRCSRSVPDLTRRRSLLPHHSAEAPARIFPAGCLPRELATRLPGQYSRERVHLGTGQKHPPGGARRAVVSTIFARCRPVLSFKSSLLHIVLGCIHIDTGPAPGLSTNLHVFQWQPFTLIRILYCTGIYDLHSYGLLLF